MQKSYGCCIAAIKQIPNISLFRIFRDCVDLAILFNGERERERKIKKHRIKKY